MKSINLNKVFATKHGEPVRGLEFFVAPSKKKSLIKPEPLIKGKFLYKDEELNQTTWLECIWNADGTERIRMDAYKSHDLIEMQPKSQLKSNQLSIF